MITMTNSINKELRLSAEQDKKHYIHKVREMFAGGYETKGRYNDDEGNMAYRKIISSEIENDSDALISNVFRIFAHCVEPWFKGMFGEDPVVEVDSPLVLAIYKELNLWTIHISDDDTADYDVVLQRPDIAMIMLGEAAYNNIVMPTKETMLCNEDFRQWLMQQMAMN